MSSLHPLLVIKRLTEFALFAYLAVVASFVQSDTSLICQLTGKLRATNARCLSFIGLIVLAASFFVIILITLWSRYVLHSQALLASILYVAVFTPAAALGISVRLYLAPAVACQTILTWPPDGPQFFAVAYSTVFAASIFVAVLNVVTPQKADYSDARLKLDDYLGVLPAPVKTDEEHRNQSVPAIANVSAALQKAYDGFSKAVGSETSARYRNFVTSDFLRPLETLIGLASGVSATHPEEFLKMIGYRDRGMVPDVKVREGCEAHRKIESAWRRHEN